MNDSCICCGAIIPEGSHVCQNCEVASAPAWMAKYMQAVKEERERQNKKVKKESKKVKKESKKVRVNKKLTIKVVLDEEARMPTWAHDDDAGMDLYSREDVVLHPNVRAVLDTGVHIAIPKGWCGYIKSRSGLMVKKGVITDGTIDSGYTGSIGVILFNLSGKRVEISKGERIAQITFHRCEHPTLVQVDSLEETERGCGGFGSTGKF